jgi:hypothetical protein
MNRIFKHIRRADDRERGATAILVAVSLLVLIGFAAIAVDSGIAYADRREQQSAADVGALAALQFARTTPPATHPDCAALTDSTDIAACRGAEEALAVIDGTLPGRYSDADWGACTDPSLDPADFSQVSFISPCINFTSTLQRVRVVLPGTDVATTFARVIGFDSIRVGAFAEAGLELDIIGGVLPFAIGPSGSGSNQACFAAGDTEVLDIAPCGSGSEGNYGKLDIRLYGNENYPTPQICSGGNGQRMITNIVAGSDHPLEPNPPKPTAPPNPVVDEVTNCANITNPVNQFDVATGNNPTWVNDGFLQGITTPPNLEGRLLCKGGKSSNTSREDYPLGSFTSTLCETVNNTHPEKLDHSPLWTYITPGANAQALGGGCDPGAWTKKGRDKMETCIANWKAWPTPHTISLFTDDIAKSPRFAGVPILDKDPGNGTSVKYTIKEFKPVYLETLYLGCNANTCSTVHSPGEVSTGSCPAKITPADWSCGWPGNGAKPMEAMSAFILELDMLPADLADKFPYQEGTIVYNLSR